MRGLLPRYSDQITLFKYLSVAAVLLSAIGLDSFAYSLAPETAKGDAGSSNRNSGVVHEQVEGLATEVTQVSKKTLFPGDEATFCENAKDWKNFQAILTNVNDKAKSDFGYVYLSKSSLDTSLKWAKDGTEDTYISHYKETQEWPGIYKVEGSMGPANRLSFQSYGEIFGVNTGLCWWHSRFNRSALYLSIVRPLLPGEKEMTDAEAIETVRTIFANKRVVTIRGFNNIFEFSARFQDLIVKELSNWAERETIQFGWIKAIRQGSSEPAQLKESMDDLYKQVHDNGLVAYQMLKPSEFIGAHSWLVYEMERILVSDNKIVGYRLHVVDPGAQQRDKVVEYHFGEIAVDSGIIGFGNIRPYTQYEDDFPRIAAAMLEKCNPTVFRSRLEAAARDYVGKRAARGPRSEQPSNPESEFRRIMDNYRELGSYPESFSIVSMDELQAENWRKLISTSAN